ncbi:unnamed protein product [Staurois parvus]|uniref:Uncharacterized protein n=1 Tax=Staurois parvus TaxID=386267 RepID=A0ABN9GY57_9NEOB|nr:unnamed protein product [Staurois parvus]
MSVLSAGNTFQRSLVRDLTRRKSCIPVQSAGNVFHVSPIFIYTSDNTRGTIHTLVQRAGNVFHRSPACIYIRDLT